MVWTARGVPIYREAKRLIHLGFRPGGFEEVVYLVGDVQGVGGIAGGGDGALSIDHIGVGDTADEIGLNGRAWQPYIVGLVPAFLGDEAGGQVGGVIRAGGEHDHFVLPLRVLGEGQLEAGQVFPAGRAPGGPELQDDNFAGVVGEMFGSAIGQVNHGDVGRWHAIGQFTVAG